MIPKLRFKDDNGNDFPAWNTTVRLEEISAFITKGATPTTYGFEWQVKGIHFFRNNCIKNNVFVYGDFSYISEEANEFLKRSEIRGDDIVISEGRAIRFACSTSFCLSSSNFLSQI